jgi:hypothetical protein
VSRIRESARNEDCTVRLPDTCKWLPEYTIWSHAPFSSGGKGRSIKAIDECGAYACTACDAVVDGQAPPPQGYSKQDVTVAWFHGHLRSLVILKKKGLIK